MMAGTLGTEQLMRDQASTTGSWCTAAAAGSSAAPAAAAASALPADDRLPSSVMR